MFQVGNYDNYKNLASILRAKRKLEQDEELLANRVALLQEEELKNLKKIQETKTRADEIVQKKRKLQDKKDMVQIISFPFIC